MAQALDLERECDKRDHLCRERADRGGDGKAEEPDTQQIKRQDRCATTELVTYQNEAHQQRRNDLHQAELGGRIVCQGLQAAHEQREGHGVQRRADEIRAPFDQGCDGKSVVRDHDGRDADRNVDAEQPAPVGHRENGGTDGGPDGSCHGDREGVQADRAAEFLVWPGEAHQRRIDRHDTGGAQPLHDASDTHHGQGSRQRAADRSRDKHRHPQLRDTAIPDDLSQRGQRQQRCQDGDLIGVDHPDRGRLAGVEFPANGRQRDVGDRAVDHRHGQGEDDGRNRPVASRGR